MAVFLLFGRSRQVLHNSFIGGWGCGLRLQFWRCLSGSIVSFSARWCTTSCAGASELGGNHVDTQERLWEDLFSNPLEWWDNRLEKRSYRHPDFRHKRTRDPLWLDNYQRPDWVDSRLATLDIQLQSGRSGLQSTSGLVDELHHSCGEGQLDRALDLLVLMDQQGILPSLKVYSSLLKACIKRKALVQAKRLHVHLSKHALESTKFLGESLVVTLVKCGSLEDGLHVFDRLTDRTVFSWTAIISGYTIAGHGKEALRLYKCMQEEGLAPNAYTFVTLLKACSSICDLEEGKHIHAEILKHKCDSDLFVRTCLVDMYAKCGSIVDAEKVFEESRELDVVSWNALLAAYAQHGYAEKALHLYDKMQEMGVSPNEWTLVGPLRACGMLAEKGVSTKAKALEKGKALHADVHRKGYDSNEFVSSALLSMYAKCGSIVDAQMVFDELSNCDLVAWTAMLAAYCQEGQASKALELYEQMQAKGLSPNDRTFVSTLEACGMLAEKEKPVLVNGKFTKVKSLEKGRTIHADAQRKGYDSYAFVGNTLISMYGKCGSIVDAQDVFDGLCQRDVVSWTAMLTAHVDQGQPEETLQLYEQMLAADGVSPNDRTFVTLVQACGMLADKEEVDVGGGYTKVKSLEKGKAVHLDAQSKGYGSDVFVANTLVSMYGKCRSIVDARDVFDGLPQRDVVSWNAMLVAYVEQGEADHVLQLYEDMLQEEVSANDRTLVSTLQACGMIAEREEVSVEDRLSTKAKFLGQGKAVHAHAWRKGYDSDTYVGSTLLSMYRKCGSIADVESVFGGLVERQVISWNTMLMAYVEQGQAEEAIQFYGEMQVQGVSANIWTFVTALQVCAMLAEKEEGDVLDGQSVKGTSLGKGKAIHAAARRKAYDLDAFVGNTLVNMYGNCGDIAGAQYVFDGLWSRDVVSWTAMLTAYAHLGRQAEKAMQLYEQMQGEGISPDVQTFMCVLQACGMAAEEEEDAVVDGRSMKVHALEMVKVIHAQAQMKGYDLDVFVGSTLVSMYGKCGSLMDSQMVFDGLSFRDTVSCTAMLAACIEQGEAERALQLYEQMRKEGIWPDETTAICVLQASSITGSLETCRQIHDSVVSVKSGPSTLVGNSLIHAYGRCASMVDAQTVFDELPQPDVVSWNAVIAGYARQGNCVASLQTYEKMQVAGTEPNGVTFLSLLSACSHAGLLDTGVQYFESMSRDYGLTPEIEHYVSMVDLFGRAGCFTSVEDLLSSMPMQPDMAIWLCLLSACRKHGNVVLGKQAFDRAVQLEPTQSAPYLLMWNIYVDAGLWDCAMEMKELRRKKGAWKKPGQSWIQHEQVIHLFLVSDQKHPQYHQVRDILRRLDVGWSPTMAVVV